MVSILRALFVFTGGMALTLFALGALTGFTSQAQAGCLCCSTNCLTGPPCKSKTAGKGCTGWFCGAKCKCSTGGNNRHCTCR
jgi:hypothetical protein